MNVDSMVQKKHMCQELANEEKGLPLNESLDPEIFGAMDFLHDIVVTAKYLNGNPTDL